MILNLQGERPAWNHGPLPVSLPEGAVRCRVRQRAGSFTRLFIRFADGRFEEWIASIRRDARGEHLCPYLLQGRNLKKRRAA
jgi:hypothetical protein